MNMTYKGNYKLMAMLMDITIDNPDMDAALKLKILDAAQFANDLMKFEEEKELIEAGVF